MSLFRVSVNATIMVEADNTEDAIVVAYQHAREWVADLTEADYSAHQVVCRGAIPTEWMHAIPWGSTDDRECAEIMEVDP